MILQPFLQDKPPYLQIIIFILIIIASLFFINVLGILIAIPIYGHSFLNGMSEVIDYSDPGYLSKLKYLQIVNQFAFFIIPVLLFAMFTGKTVHGYLKLNTRPPFAFLLISLGIILVSMPVLNWLSDLNAAMKLPQSLAGVEAWMRNSETQAKDITDAFLKTVSLKAFMVNFLMIAILPAVGEELFFRGVLQRIFQDWFKNIHVAIIVTATVFSIFHFQFYGFFPRLVLGIYLGYIFYWSGSLWVSILVHFLNNGLIVIVSYIAAKGYANLDADNFGNTNSIPIFVSTLVFTCMLIYLLFRLRRKTVDLDKLQQ
jgi:uncharacterized protein